MAIGAADVDASEVALLFLFILLGFVEAIWTYVSIDGPMGEF